MPRSKPTDLRIWMHPILRFDRGRKVSFFLNDEKFEAYENETIASALYANNLRILSRSVKLNRFRGFFCGIGKCSTCLMRVNGVPNVKTCVVKVKDGMRVEVQENLGDAPSLDNGFELNFLKEYPAINTDVAIIGGGPAGLSSAIYAAKYGVNVLLIDENDRLGGQLIKQTHRFFGSEEFYAGVRGIDIAEVLSREVGEYNIGVMLNSTVFGIYEDNVLGVVNEEGVFKVSAKKIIVSTGAFENYLVFENNDLPGVMGAGAAQTLMNVYGVKPGENILVVGAGNVGLIISYQMLQAGVNVEAVVEAMPKISGYMVHASKIRRYGVPILLSHTIKRAIGSREVEGATIVRLDENFREIAGSEEDVEVDAICLAVGLTPSYQLLFQAGCDMKYIPELGGEVPLRDDFMRTSINDIYVAGDVSGVEEATTAMLEGRIAGISAALSIVGEDRKAEELRKEFINKLKEFRAGPFSEKINKGINLVSIGRFDEKSFK